MAKRRRRKYRTYRDPMTLIDLIAAPVMWLAGKIRPHPRPLPKHGEGSKK